MEPAPALAAAAEPAAGAPLAAAVQPSTCKRRDWLSQLPVSASEAHSPRSVTKRAPPALPGKPPTDTPAPPPPYELTVESPDGDVQSCIVDPSRPLRETLLCLDLPRGSHLHLDGDRLDTNRSSGGLGLAHGAVLQSFWPQAGGGYEEDEALLDADFETEREMEAEREMPMEAVTSDEAEASGGLAQQQLALPATPFAFLKSVNEGPMSRGCRPSVAQRCRTRRAAPPLPPSSTSSPCPTRNTRTAAPHLQSSGWVPERRQQRGRTRRVSFARAQACGLSIH